MTQTSVPSVRSRFLASFLANGFNGLFMFLSGVLVARSLGAVDYGRFVFLMGTFQSLMILLDMGAQHAFFTFIAQKDRPRGFYRWYFLWMFLQWSLPSLFIGLLLPQVGIEWIWLREPRLLVVLAFTAFFLRQPVWGTIVLMGESARLTYRAQGMTACINAVHLVIIASGWWFDWLTLPAVFALLIAEYAAAAVIAFRVIWKPRLLTAASSEGTAFSAREMFGEYGAYCLPIALTAALGFFYQFADTWLLQHFGGSTQQAYFGIGSRFSTMSALASIAMLRIFWKEIAESFKKSDVERMRHLYTKVTRFLYLVSAALSGFLIPWSEDLVRQLLGPEYLPGSAALAIMFLYPLHQSLGQIVGSMYFATELTRPQAVINVVVMLVSVPMGWIALAPPDALIPGLGAGAVGLAAKTILLQVLSINLQMWWFCRKYGWKWDWLHQVLALAIPLGFGWLARSVLLALALPLPAVFILAGILYLICLGVTVRFFPSLAGATAEEVDEVLKKLRHPRTLLGG